MKLFSINSLFLLFLLSSVEASAINVAVVESADGGQGGGAATIVQLNDDTFYDFTATLVNPSMVDSAAELASYDVVVIGGSGHGIEPVWSVAMANALKVFVEGGGGVLMTGYGHWNSFDGGIANLEPAAILDTFVPGDIDNSYSYTFSCCSLGLFIELTDPGHPITKGLPTSVPYGEGCCLEYNRHELQAGDVSLGVPSPVVFEPGHALIYRDNIGAGKGRSVYLGAPHLGEVNSNASLQLGLRYGPGDQLLEQALAWLASAGAAEAGAGGDAESDDSSEADGNAETGGSAEDDLEADTDGDGVPDYDDFCANTRIPEDVPTVQLKPNHWALIDEVGFGTLSKGKGKGPNRSYTLRDTAGCSCEQIIEAQGLGYGLTMHGCSIGVMDNWVKLVTP